MECVFVSNIMIVFLKRKNMYGKRIKSFAGCFGALLVFALAISINAQGVAKKKSERVSDHKLGSKLMKRDMPYRVVLPADYGVSNKKKLYPTIYLLHGLTGNYRNWVNRTKLIQHSSSYEYIIVMPEGDNGWYTDSETIENDKYESYIVKELIPEIEKKFRARKERSGRAIAGLSMGGYGSIKFGMKYPKMFVLAGSFSGALRASEWYGPTSQGFRIFTESIMATFGEKESKTRKENNIFANLQTEPKENLRGLPFFYLDCGTEDFLIKQNQDFANLLMKKRVPHEFRQLPGTHNWRFWDVQIREFLMLSKKFVR